VAIKYFFSKTRALPTMLSERHVLRQLAAHYRNNEQLKTMCRKYNNQRAVSGHPWRPLQCVRQAFPLLPFYSCQSRTLGTSSQLLAPLSRHTLSYTSFLWQEVPHEWNCMGEVKVKLSLYQAVEAPHIVYTVGSQMTVRLSALRPGRPLPPGRFLILISVRG
jgi:hypothetical protein